MATEHTVDSVMAEYIERYGEPVSLDPNGTPTDQIVANLRRITERILSHPSVSGEAQAACSRRVRAS